MSEIEDEEYISKVVGQFGMTLTRMLNPLRLYGQAPYVDSVSTEIIKLAWQMHWKLEGMDIPYEVQDLHW